MGVTAFEAVQGAWGACNLHQGRRSNPVQSVQVRVATASRRLSRSSFSQLHRAATGRFGRRNLLRSIRCDLAPAAAPAAPPATVPVEPVESPVARPEGHIAFDEEVSLVKESLSCPQIPDDSCVACVLDRHWLLRNPTLNKGTAFSEEERRSLGIQGLLPPQVENLDLQAQRVMRQLRSYDNPINRYIVLSSLHQSNETLYYHLLISYLPELLPIVYTPTVGEACLKYGDIFRSSQGMYFSLADKGMIRSLLDHWPHNEVDVIVVTDGGRILGLGDLGANGMPIPVGKLALYVAGGGFQPSRTLPCLLDLGTDNEDLLRDPLYLGSRHKRVTGDEYMALIDEFVDAVKDKWPNALIQFEDFKTESAIEVLERHRYSSRCFNDDIQGTGAVIAAGLINACKAQQMPLSEARILFYGAGSAAVGVAQTICGLLEDEGLSSKEARDRIWMVDRKGIITADRGNMEEHKKLFARRDIRAEEVTSLDLKGAVEFVRPTALLGLSGTPAVFTREVIEAMCAGTPRPAIFPLSNPTSKAEITAADAIEWSKGAAIFAAGSPFPPVDYNGRIIVPGQGNNMFIFPGVGFGAAMCRTRVITDTMFIAAARALASCVSDAELEIGSVFPTVSRVREISAQVAVAVMEKAFEERTAAIQPPADLLAFVKERMYQAEYIADMHKLRLAYYQ